ncbi:MAG TPA: TolC family protein [Fibrobacteria bacterium]|nr:TolC family protein [Fibrobacteria bacterium]
MSLAAILTRSIGVPVLVLSLLAVPALPWAQAAPDKPKPKASPLTEDLLDEDEDAAPAPAVSAPTAPAPSAPASTAAPAVDAAGSVWVADYRALEKRAQEVHPILREKRLNVVKSEQQIRELEMSAIVPKFTVETAVGPAPGLRNEEDTSSLRLPDSLGGGPVRQFSKEYDLSTWGPYFGIEMTAAQPLNIGRYRAGHRARAFQLKVTEAELQKERMDVSEEAQRLYFQRVFAGMMRSVLDEAARELDKAQRRMEAMLDDGDKGVTQTDLLELKAGRYALEKNRSEAGLGVSRTELGLQFLVNQTDSLRLRMADSVLTLRKETLPPLDSLKLLTLENHPDLKRLKNGLAARSELIRVAKGEMGPDIFLFGNFKYTKAWSTDRESGGDNPFARDPLNEITAVGGIGLKLNLNFWQRYERVRKERIELKQLQRTEAYAAAGLLLKLQDEYVQMLKYRADVTESQKSLRAAEAWLKAAAMKYDLDPGAAKDMISPYRTVLTAKRDYFQAVLDYNLAVSKVIRAMGWTLSDFIHSLGG